MSTPTSTSKPKTKTKKRNDPAPAASATPDRGEAASLEKQAKPAFSPSLQHGGGSPGMGPGPATSVVGSNEGVVEAEIPDGPSASD